MAGGAGEPVISVEALVAAFGLPAAAQVDRRVPKTMLMQHAGFTAADRRAIADGVEEVRWIASLKAGNCGVPPYRDAEREYLEIAVAALGLREGASETRLTELLHRAIPYPLLLVAHSSAAVVWSVAHKRWSLAAEGRVVLDAAPESADVREVPPSMADEMLATCAMARQPGSDMKALYEGWCDVVTAVRTAAVTGRFTLPREAGSVRRQALEELREIDEQVARVEKAAQRERQTARLVELNLELKRLRERRAAALNCL
ncbi:MAG: DUF4391 domain-containing protein [Gemmatimonadetes bacterium]|nr:DUF4391 domain-containing protein [Gemmatimonadota bacterium]